MKIEHVSTVLKIVLCLLLIILALLFMDTFQRLMGINCHAEYTFEVPICSQMNNLGTVCLTSILFLIAGWGIMMNILPFLGEDVINKAKKFRIVIFLVIMVLVVALAIVANYFSQRIDRWSF